MNAFWLKYLPDIIRVRLDGRHHLQQAVGNSGWLLADKVTRLMIGLVIGVWMARVLGPAQFGQFNYALAFVALFSSVATLGLDGIVVRNLVHTPDAKNQILGSAFILKIIGSLLAISLCVILIFFVEPENPQTQMLVAVISAGLLFQALDVVDFWFQSRVTSMYTVIAKIPALFVFFCVRVALLVGTASLIAFAWVQSLELLLGSIGLVIVYQRLGDRITAWRPLYTYAMTLIKESWPLILAGLSVMLYMKIDIVMLGKMSGDRETGLYSAASRLSEGFYFVPMVIVSSLTPMLLRARALGNAQYKQSMLNLYVLMIRLSILMATPFAIFAPLLVEMLFGDNYASSAAILRVHIWAAVAVFLGVASSQYLTAEGQQKMSLYRTLTGLIVNIGLNVLLIPTYGAMGAAIATLVSYFVATFTMIVTRDGAEQVKLMLIAMNPAVVLGLRAAKWT